MKEKPIIYSGEMVRAILDGRKTQTRRIIKNSQVYKTSFEKCDNETIRELRNALATLPQPSACENGSQAEELKYWHTICPYGNTGDRLWTFLLEQVGG
jgi:hypothetical protein